VPGVGNELDGSALGETIKDALLGLRRFGRNESKAFAERRISGEAFAAARPIGLNLFNESVGGLRARRKTDVASNPKT
jgi:hypothetical protein